jgi:pSer/pThr/pTyr-binding forkhead associated (FHA) protein
VPKTSLKPALRGHDWPVLKPLRPDPASAAVALNRPVCVVGSRSRVHLPLAAPTVSRSHALIVNGGRTEGVYVRDLASCNGIYVNGAAVREAVLRDGDEIRVGPFTYGCASGFGSRGEEARSSEANRNGDDEADATCGEMELHVAGTWLRDGRVAVHGRSAVVGLREDCDVILPGPGVDAAHAVLFRRDGKWYVRDLDSTTGTFVNGRPVRESVLAPGDGIRVGEAEIRYVLGLTPARLGGSRDAGLESPWESIEAEGTVADADAALAGVPVAELAEGRTAASGPAWLASAPLATVRPVSHSASPAVNASQPEEPIEVLGIDGPSEHDAVGMSGDLDGAGVAADGLGGDDSTPIPLAIDGDTDSQDELISSPAVSGQSLEDAADPIAAPAGEPEAVQVEPTEVYGGEFAEESRAAEEELPPVMSAAARPGPSLSYLQGLAAELAVLEKLDAAEAADGATEFAPDDAVLDMPVGPITEAEVDEPTAAMSSEHPSGGLPAHEPLDVDVAIGSGELIPAAQAASPVRRITRLVGRMSRDVIALNTAWRALRRGRPEWSTDDPDRPVRRPSRTGEPEPPSDGVGGTEGVPDGAV